MLKIFYLFYKMLIYGPSFWRFIHYYAMSDHELPINELKQFLPDDWKSEWYDYSSSCNSLKEWSIQMHNKVNKKLGKYSNWDLVDFDIGHKNSCDFCDNNENNFNFPWGVFYQIARNTNNTSNETIIQVLKYFNETYPHEKCRGRYLIDIPHESETLIEWVGRNHKRMNNEFNLFDKPEQIN